MSKFNYKWSLKDYPKKKNIKVFSTFACGGGSTMGYKLNGYDVIAANDIDAQMAEVYKANHNPKHYFHCPIGDLLEQDLPEELYNLDILDGSPPCSTFSMAGKREKNWKKDKRFREGQSKQVLSDLFFDWIRLVEKLQPKVAIAENVKGILLGNAKSYCSRIVEELDRAGYRTQIFLLNASQMGVPQMRSRVFFICLQKDLYPEDKKVLLKFDETPITYKEIAKHVSTEYGKPLSEAYKRWWDLCPYGSSFSKVHPKGSYFNTSKVSPFKVMPTIIATAGAKLTHYEKPYEVSNEILALAGSYPTDYNYLDIDPKYLIGMSVPPVMIAQVARQLEAQGFIKET